MLARVATATARLSTAVGGSYRSTLSSAIIRGLSLSERPFSGYSDSITYSGGQASEGQGGFYGSGGARASKLETEHKPEMVALATDVENLTLVMEEVYKLEEMLEEEKAKADGGVSGKALEISSKIKKIMTSVDVMECLKRLEVEGEPVWGLSSEERELVYDARQKVNEC
ncbi:hypothetical protein HJC23_009899 [Cyclotella cryptica]|uniref:Uncharacterized protein n=1 Tax=Cyclotella cryptica TaxID=29204 RepID=A0ABD3QHS6_9STRA|eukprot:CCRYP_007027-RA/>CCRYP_007027-RA protein AED:0.11 eAED:0.11 QI:147/1/1/1/1/1/3/196/169